MGAGAGAGLYGDMLRAEAKLLEKIPSSYILGEFLAEDNHALQFLEFSADAAKHGLAFLCEADLDAGARSGLRPEGHRHVDELARGDRALGAQELDFLSGRPFRRTLLRRQTTQLRIGAPAAAHLQGLHVAAKLTPDPSAAEKSGATFVDRHGRRLTPRVPAIGEAFLRLSKAYPATLPIDAMTNAAGAEGSRVAHALLRLAASGRALLSTVAIEVGSESDARPQVWPYARAEAVMGLPGLTNLHHVTVAVSPMQAKVAAIADGTRNHADLARQLSASPDAPSDAEAQVGEALLHLSTGAVLAR
jgi:hypothetical protein